MEDNWEVMKVEKKKWSDLMKQATLPKHKAMIQPHLDAINKRIKDHFRNEWNNRQQQ